MTEALDHEAARRDNAACACQRVTYQPVTHPDGTVSERWACNLCNSGFQRMAVVADAQAKIEAWRPIVEHAQDLANDGNCPFCTMGLGGDTHEDFCPFSALPPEHRP